MDVVFFLLFLGAAVWLAIKLIPVILKYWTE
jgi:hypothetical protein